MKIHIAVTILCLILSNNSRIRAESNHFFSDSLPINTRDLAAKVIIKDKKLFYRSKNINYPYFMSIDNSIVKKNYLPVVWNYRSFTQVEGAWDIEENEIWAVNGGSIVTENSYCADIVSSLYKIPLRDTAIWNHSKKILNKDSLTQLIFSYPVLPRRLPVNIVIMKKYSAWAFIAQKEKFINFRTIKDSLAANTYFNFLISSKKEPIYFLLTEGKLSIWKIGKDSDGHNEWQLDRKYPLPKFVKFHCFEKDGKLYVLTDEGTIYIANKRKLKKVKQIAINNFDDQILIVDKDNDQVKLLNKNNLTSLENLEKEINAKSISLF